MIVMNYSPFVTLGRVWVSHWDAFTMCKPRIARIWVIVIIESSLSVGAIHESPLQTRPDGTEYRIDEYRINASRFTPHS